MKKSVRFLFLLVVLLCMLFPLAALPISPTYTPTQDSDLTDFPTLATDEGWNQNYLSELGDYFQDHFAFRQHLITLNSAVYDKIFHVSATDQVILGTKGWMYYAGTLNDYLVRNRMSERAVQNAVHNLKLLQDHVESRDSRFLLVIAPNKNSIYDANMPYYYQKGSGTNNLYALQEALAAAGVHTIDLCAAFAAEEDVLYLQQDSHWNNQGAALVYQQVMRRLGLPFTDYDYVPSERRKDHTGDIAEMLYPLGSEPEENVYYQKEQSYSYVSEDTDDMAAWLETSNSDMPYRLLFYRDSFGSSLIPFFSESFGSVYYSRLVPYNLANLDQYHPNYTIVERAERNIATFASQPAIMQAPEAEITVTATYDTDTSLSLRADGGYYILEGKIDHQAATLDSEIYLQITSEDGTSVIYRPFHVTVQSNGESDDYGYLMYLEKQLAPTGEFTVSVLVANDTACTRVKTQQMNP